MTDRNAAPITPRFADHAALRVVGRARRYTFAETARVPELWREVVPEMFDRMRGVETFGVSYDIDADGFSYLVGVADAGRFDTDGYDHVTLPAGRHAVFDHPGDVSTIPRTWEAAFAGGGGAYTVGDGPKFERYVPDYDPSRSGGVSIWLPLADG